MRSIQNDTQSKNISRRSNQNKHTKIADTVYNLLRDSSAVPYVSRYGTLKLAQFMHDFNANFRGLQQMDSLQY